MSTLERSQKEREIKTLTLGGVEGAQGAHSLSDGIFPRVRHGRVVGG
jgi:hypothetical protein